MVDIPVSAMPRMDGQVALVTGSAGGIGSQVVRTFVAAGATVKKAGFETAIALSAKPKYVAVQALGANGQVLGTSKTLKRS